MAGPTTPKSQPATPKAQPANPKAQGPAPVIARVRFEDEFPVMFRFYSERGRLNETQMQKVQEIQQRWKAGCVYWLTHDNREVEIPEWVAVNVVVNNKQNLVRGSRICMSLNHTKGYGCNRLGAGTCTYVHECALCGMVDHGVFQKRGNGKWYCEKLRKWYDEESRYEALGFGDPRKHEDVLTDIAKQPRPSRVFVKSGSGSNVWDTPKRPSTASEVSLGSDATNPLPGQPASSPSGAQTNGKKTKEATSLQQKDQAVNVPAARPGKESASEETSAGSANSGSPISRRPPSEPPPPPPPPEVPQDWQALWCEDQRAYYYWNTATGTVTWQAPTDASGACNGNGVGEQVAQTDRSGVVTQDSNEVRSNGTAEQNQTSASGERGTAKIGVEYVSTQHWKPQDGILSCLSIIQGERLVVTWTDEDQAGWAYGHVNVDPTKCGYFPQAVLQVPRRPQKRRDAGEVCRVTEAFIAPADAEADRYLTVTAGDLVRVLQMEAASAWAFAERISEDCTSQVGWLAEILLQGTTDDEDVSEGGRTAAHA